MLESSEIAHLDALRHSYSEDRYVHMPCMLSQDMLDVVVPYAHILGATGRMTPDPAVGHSVSRYGSPGFDALLVSLLGTVSAVAGTTLVPSYSFARTYFRGDELKRHRDRPACEHSVTVHLDSSGGKWPVCFERLDRRETSLELRAGDALMYRGIELPHWREPCPTDWYLQVFLHWVERDGPHGDQIFDGREGLGMANRRKIGLQ